MPVTLTEDERKRLAKLAGMLGSQYDGEKLNALGMIQKLADAKKCRVDELLLSGKETVREVVREVVRWRDRPQDKPEPEDDDDWKAQMNSVLKEHALRSFLTDWEAKFAADMSASRWSEPTEKQAVYIAKIWEKFQKRAAQGRAA